MPQGSFAKYLSGFTSDHTYQTATVTNYCQDGTELTLTGMTWNILNKGRAAVDDKHGNNPFDLEEDEASYIARKKNQLKFIWKHIKKGDIDFFCLQEVDIFYMHPRLDFVDVFLNTITKKGWKVLASSHDDGLHRPLIILYDTTKLGLLSKRGVFPTKKNGKYTGFEGTFKLKGKQICLVNIHLDYETDHREEILNYQMQQIAADKFTVIAGDANHVPGKEQYSLVGDKNMATNVYKIKSSELHKDLDEGLDKEVIASVNEQ